MRYAVFTFSVCLAACGDGSGSSDDSGGAGAHQGGQGGSAGRPTFDASCDDPGVVCHEFGPVDVAPGDEWQGFETAAVGNTEDVAIVKMEVSQTGTTSHHYIVTLWSGTEPPPLGGPFDLFSSEGVSLIGDTLGAIVAGSVYKYLLIDTGAYVGMKVPANSFFIHNGHYLNTSPETQRGITNVKIQTAPARDVRFLAVEAQPGITEINVPPREERTIERTWTPPSDIAILFMTSHMHRHGSLFKAWAHVDGVDQEIYETTEYDGPPLKIFGTPETGPPVVLRPERGDHLRFQCTHVNFDLDVPLTFGPTAETHEMCILPVVYIDEPDAYLSLLESGEDASYGWYYEPNGG